METRTSTELKKILEIIEADKRDVAQQMKAMQDQIQELLLSNNLRTNGDSSNFGDSVNKEGNGSRHSNAIKVDIPEYDGKLDPDEFVEWLRTKKFDFRAGLEAVLEGGLWLIRKSLITLKKWSMDTRLLKEELTRIPIWVKLHDDPIQVFEKDDISLIATFIGKPVMLDSYTSSMCNELWGRSSFARCLIKVNLDVDLVDVVTIGIPYLFGDGFTKETIRKKKKGKSKSTNDGQFTGPSVKKNVRYEPKATTIAPKKGATYVDNTSQSSSMLKTPGNLSKKDNISMSNSFSALNDEEEDDEEDVEIVHDESANLNTKAGGSSSFTAAAG
nr:hypothetical protein [Tanacetum cinerariifolium]